MSTPTGQTTGHTPLSWAAMTGHWQVVKQLLDRQDISSDWSDNEGNTPLSWAAINGHESVVKQLLDRPVNPDKCCYEFWIEEESAGEMKKDEEVKKAVYVY